MAKREPKPWTGSDRKPICIEVRSLVSGRNLEPYIALYLKYDDQSEEQITQWTPQEAEGHARQVLACIEAANTDAFLVEFLTSRVGIGLAATGPVLEDFRKWRVRRATPEKAQ